MPTSKVVATENTDTFGKAGTSAVGTPEGVGIAENTGTKNSRRSDSSGKHRNTESRKFRPVRKHRKFDSSERHPGTSISGRRRVGGRWNGSPVKGPRHKAGSRKERRQMRVSRGAWRDRSRRAEDPKIPKSLKLSLRGSVEKQAQHRQDRLGEPWSESV
jgi:hypothetical protein